MSHGSSRSVRSVVDDLYEQNKLNKKAEAMAKIEKEKKKIAVMKAESVVYETFQRPKPKIKTKISKMDEFSLS